MVGDQPAGAAQRAHHEHGREGAALTTTPPRERNHTPGTAIQFIFKDTYKSYCITYIKYSQYTYCTLFCIEVFKAYLKLISQTLFIENSCLQSLILRKDKLFFGYRSFKGTVQRDGRRSQNFCFYGPVNNLHWKISTS